MPVVFGPTLIAAPIVTAGAVRAGGTAGVGPPCAVAVALPAPRREPPPAVAAAPPPPADESVVNQASGRRRKYRVPYKGVYPCNGSGDNLWQAQISVNGTTHHLGVFSSAVDAALAYDEQARVFGRKLNFADSCAPREATAHVYYGHPALARPAAMCVPMHGYARGVVAGYPLEPLPLLAQKAPHGALSDALSGADSYLAGMGAVAMSVAEASAGEGDGLPTLVGPPQWVGVPLGRNELAAFWQAAGAPCAGAPCAGACATAPASMASDAVARPAKKRPKTLAPVAEPRPDAASLLFDAIATQWVDGTPPSLSVSSEDDADDFSLFLLP